MIDFENPVKTNESAVLLLRYLQYKVLSENNRDDLQHIALATVLTCDIIVSRNFDKWNFFSTFARLDNMKRNEYRNH